MDDIYDNLDNYEDLNIVEELKKENHDLKLKLEEYTIAMSKLQKDFDKLSSDFQKLEMNYSSLLKTAKVEIERKTKIISDLNIEKDMIVLNSLRSRNENDVRKLKSVTKPYVKGPSNDSSFGKVRTNAPLIDNIKMNINNDGRKEDIRFSSVETTTTSGNTDIGSRLMQLAKNSASEELWVDRTSDAKENIAQRNKIIDNNNKPANTQALSIKNRRKSMPAVRSNAKYSSDEECEDRYCSNDANKKISREDANRQNLDLMYGDRHRYKRPEERNKSSEMSNVDDKYYGYSDAIRDSSHRSKTDRYQGFDKHRNKNRYDNSLRHKRHFSPERSRRTYRNDDYHRPDYGRFRVLESPPPDKYQYYQQRNQDTRNKRDRDDMYGIEKRDNYPEKYSTKHKTNVDHYDEPISKRQRTDSYSKISGEQIPWSRDRVLEKPAPDLYDNLNQDFSCQSPDYIVNDAFSSHPIREIMNTATAPLEDPRIHSKRYIVKNTDDTLTLSTVTGRNVDIKFVDTTHWNITPVEVPKSLTRRPSQCNDDIVKEIYMDIDNPVSNMSAEPGENLSFNAEDNVPDRNEPNVNKNDVSENNKQLPNKIDDKINLSSYKIPKIKKNEPEIKFPSYRDINVQQSEGDQPVEISKKDEKRKIGQEQELKKKTQVEKGCIFETSTVRNEVDSSYKIPKTKKNELEIKFSSHRDIDIPQSKEDQPADISTQDQKRNVAKEQQLKKKTKVEKACLFETSTVRNEDTAPVNFEDNFSESMTRLKELVADDLEMSDETCDNSEILKKSALKISQSKDKCPAEKVDKNKVSLEGKGADLWDNTSDKNKEKDITLEKQCDSIKDDCKKRNSKKKIHKHKETPKTAKAESINKDTDKKVKSKRDSKDPKEIKTKFSELFGDSSSLITPEDLGIMAMQAQAQSAASYVPICEDAQDAVDVTVSSVGKVQTRSKLKLLESGQFQDGLETEKDGSRTEPKIKTQHKSSNDSKKKTRKNADHGTDKSKIREVYESLTADKLVTDKGSTSQNTENEVIKPAFLGTNAPSDEAKEIEIKIVPELKTLNDNNKSQKPKEDLADEQHNIKPSDILQKPNILMKALATSTPQKEIKHDNSGVVATFNRPSSSKETIDDVGVADQSSNNDTMNSQDDVDVPDVRIFVKRKRRGKVLKQQTS